MALNPTGAIDPKYGFNAETNKRIAEVTGYTGQFGNGDFDKWLQTEAGKPWDTNVRRITASPIIDPVSYSPSTYAANQYTIDANKDTTQGQLKGLLETPNPIMELAKNNAMQSANSRGLLNSSIASTAGERALIESALPIAQNDASAYLNTGMTNTAAANSAAAFNASAANQADQSAMAAQNAESQFARNLTADRYKTDKQIDTNVMMNNLDNATKNNLARIESDYKTTMQSSASATTMYQTAMQEIGKINASSTLGAAAKTASIENITNNLRDAMAIIGKTSNIDVSKLLDFSANGGATSTPSAPIKPVATENGTDEAPYTTVPVNPKAGDVLTQNGQRFVYSPNYGGPLGIPIGGNWVKS